MMALHIDERGLEDVSFEDRNSMEAAALECFSDAAYGIDWSPIAGLAEQPAKLTFKVKYERDAG